jgi:putative two-component system response regulator
MDQSKKIVLIVDDTPVNLEILIEALSDEYTVRVATDGMAALANVRQSPPDAILLDVMMPGLDGFEVCRKLKANPATRDIPVIFLTALTDFTGEGWGLGLGAVDYIYKPFNPEIVKARLRIQLELMEYRNDLKRLVKTRTSELEDARRAAIAGMALLAEFRDTETGGHIIRTRSTCASSPRNSRGREGLSVSGA